MEDYECHITVNVNKAFSKQLEQIGKEYRWKTSFVNGDPDLGRGSRFFFTKHFSILYNAREETQVMASMVQDKGFHVLRKKIELIVADTANNTW